MPEGQHKHGAAGAADAIGQAAGIEAVKKNAPHAEIAGQDGE